MRKFAEYASIKDARIAKALQEELKAKAKEKGISIGGNTGFDAAYDPSQTHGQIASKKSVIGGILAAPVTGGASLLLPGLSAVRISGHNNAVRMYQELMGKPATVQHGLELIAEKRDLKKVAEQAYYDTLQKIAACGGAAKPKKKIVMKKSKC